MEAKSNPRKDLPKANSGDTNLGEKVLEKLKSIGYTEEVIFKALFPAIKEYKSERLPIFYTDFQKRVVYQQNHPEEQIVSPAEYIGHALNERGKSYETIKNCYENEKGSDSKDMKQIAFAMANVVGRSRMFMDPTTFAKLSKDVIVNEKQHNDQLEIKRKDDAEIIGGLRREHKSLFMYTDTMASHFNTLKEKVAQRINEDNEFTVSSQKGQVKAPSQMNWSTELAPLISKCIEGNPLFSDPQKWPANTQKLFSEEVEKIWANKSSESKEKSESNETPFKNSMGNIFTSQEQFPKALSNYVVPPKKEKDQSLEQEDQSSSIKPK
ncbi:MAG TPA: hypothetical protein PK657_04330 [Legionella sp.]|nr:hypothetical protein [Legionella sp.]